MNNEEVEKKAEEETLKDTLTFTTVHRKDGSIWVYAHNRDNTFRRRAISPPVGKGETVDEIDLMEQLYRAHGEFLNLEGF